MSSVKFALRRFVSMEAGIALLLLTSATSIQALAAEDGFPFGMEMTLEALPQPGSKRIPDLEIGDNGEVVLELWCKGGRGQFSVAGNPVVFVAGPMQDRSCPPARAQADDELVAALTDVTTWRRQGDFVAFSGSKTLRFRLNTN
jgi:META domain